MDKKGTQDKSMIKRKRLDARSFREWHIAQGKKHKSSMIRDVAPEKKDAMLQDSGNHCEASCMGQVQHNSETYLSHSKPQRIDSEDKSQPSSGETMLKRHGSGVLEVHSVKYEKAPLLVESVCDVADKNVMEGEPNCFMHRSKDLPDGKLCSQSFIEYWVPVGFSNLQLEKYCETLIKNSMVLCSSSKRGILDVLHDVLTTIQKCCDHPYLLDQSLEKFVNGGRGTDCYLRTGIEASGKLSLLDKFLREAKEKQLKVLIVFRSNHSKSQLINLRHILDDFIRQRFGEESYVHIYREFDRTKRRAMLDLFNDKGSGRFVLLIEKSSCQSCIKLSSVDFVILFNSDWSPINDLRSLQKMSFQSKFDCIKVLRLYSTNSIEEKVLLVAKKGTILDSNISSFSLDITHMLLLWGAVYLFDKLGDFHSRCPSISDLVSLSEPSLVQDALRELLTLLSCQESVKNSFSLISEVPELVGYNSANISLYGEKDASSKDEDIPHYAMWISLLEGKNPQWKLLPGSSLSMRRRVELLDVSSWHTDCGTKSHQKVHKKDKESKTEALYLKQRSTKPRSQVSRQRARKVAGNPTPGGNRVELTACVDHSCVSNVEEICNRRMHKLVIKQQREIREFYKTKRDKRAKLEEEHLLKLDLVNKKYSDPAVKQDELRKLDHIFKEKVEEHTHQMELKRKKLDIVHRSSWIKEKQLRDKSSTWLITNSEEQISSLAHAHSLDSKLGLAARDLVGNPINLLPEICNSILLSECQRSKETEKGTIDGSQPDDHQMVKKTEILSVEHDGENGDALIPCEAITSTKHKDPIIVPENEASLSASLCEEHSKDMCLDSKEVEGDCSTNMELAGEALCGLTGVHLEGSVSISLETGGENEKMVMVSGEQDNSTQPFNCLLDSCVFSNRNLLLSGQKDMEPLPNGNLLNGDCNLEASTGASAVAGHQSTDDSVVLLSSRIAGSSFVLEESQRGSTSGNSSTVNQGHFAPLSSSPNRETLDVDNNVEHLTGSRITEAEDRGATNLCMCSTEARQHDMENAMELHSSRLTRSSFASIQPQTCSISGNSSPLEQIMPTTEGLALPNCDNTQIPLSCQPDQIQVQFGNLGSPHLSAVQHTAGMNSPFLSAVTHELFIVGGSTIPRPANSYLQEDSSFRFSIPPTGFDPLNNELSKISKEQTEVIKIHEDKLMHLKSECKKEIEEIRKKYDLLLREIEEELLLKKQDIASRCTKVRASKLLAETMQFHLMKQGHSETLQEDMLTALLPLSTPQVPEHRILSSAELTPPSVEAVRQPPVLSSVNTIRPQNGLVLHATGNPYFYWARASPPLPHSFRPVTSLPLSNMSAPFYGAQDQQIFVCPQ